VRSGAATAAAIVGGFAAATIGAVAAQSANAAASMVRWRIVGLPFARTSAVLLMRNKLRQRHVTVVDWPQGFDQDAAQQHLPGVERWQLS
jgi:hypothetical protein